MHPVTQLVQQDRDSQLPLGDAGFKGIVVYYVASPLWLQKSLDSH